jgi:hypothetical protein
MNTTDLNMLVPMPTSGTRDQIAMHKGYEWIGQLPNTKIYFALFQRWPTQNLPAGYDYYIVSFHLEAVDIGWLKQQQVTGTIVVLFDGQDYDLKIPGVYFVPFYYWHYQLDTMIEWFGLQEKAKPNYKFSAVCNRITQSKLWIITKLLETAPDSSLIVLNSWLEEKNIHNWQPTGNVVLDRLTQIFRDKYTGQHIKIDNFDNQTQNKQNVTGNPWQPLYQNCAVHFTNESFHYSTMVEDGRDYVWPGPFLTEKTLKCLLGGTAFVPVGQFETYKTLTNLGFKFEYGFDATWDLDPGNLSRMERLVNLIEQLAEMDVDYLDQITRASGEHNQDWIVSKQFSKKCKQINSVTIEKIHTFLS